MCDGCALGTTGVRDWTLPGTHLCMVRLELLRLNTAPALDPAVLADVSTLAGRSSADLRGLGRLPEPMLRRHGDRGFRVVTLGRGARPSSPTACGPPIRARLAFYLTSRGITNEVYYAAQKAARFFGTNHIDNSARLCHAASTVAMKATLGHGASTCSYADWLDADLIVLFGSNVANNQPVTTKYLHEAKEHGAQVAVVNPYREPGLTRYWIPSIASSAIVGTTIADHWFDVHTGGDLAFLVGVLKALDAVGGVDARSSRRTPAASTRRWRDAAASTWDAIERESGVDPRRHRGVRAAADRAPEDDLRLVDGSDAARAWGRHDSGAGEPGPRARPAGRAGQRAGAHPRSFRRAGRRRGRLRAGGRSAEARARWAQVWGFEPPDEPGWTTTESHRARVRPARSTRSGWSAATCWRRCPTRRKPGAP